MIRKQTFYQFAVEVQNIFKAFITFIMLFIFFYGFYNFYYSLIIRNCKKKLNSQNSLEHIDEVLITNQQNRVDIELTVFVF